VAAQLGVAADVFLAVARTSPLNARVVIPPCDQMESEANERVHGVAIVVDEDFGDRLSTLASRLHVWLIDTPMNRAAASAVWQNGVHGQSLETGVTTFKVEHLSAPDQIVASMLGTVDDHHGHYSHEPPWSLLEVYGAEPTPILSAALLEFGFTNIARIADKEFRASRSAEYAG
jgi:hypothetical protein